MFWSEEHAAGQPVYTSNDLQMFTHTVYLNISAEVISQRCLDDKLKDRTLMSVDHLRKWQEAEISAMRHVCRQHHILFSLISEPKTSIPRISTLIRHFDSP